MIESQSGVVVGIHNTGDTWRVLVATSATEELTFETKAQPPGAGEEVIATIAWGEVSEP